MKNSCIDYFEEKDQPVDLKRLNGGLMKKEDFVKAHSQLVIACHDVFIKYDGGILLIKRDNLPAKDTPWPIGGRILRGVLTEDSLRWKVMSECNLNLAKIKYLGTSRAGFTTEPFGHGKGTDCIALVYFAEGEGELKLDPLHRSPMIITPKKYTASFRKQLHPYVRDWMDVVIKLV
ncbi:MAG TPA: hypothetical protein VJA23_00935 [Candidatus Nanoarchaeia archaeon]|nr:hypothetical protein [Candidatus Nanoarchaeia archaeon]